MESEARDKMHSTTQQAVDVGTAMNAWRVLLTHFSQRYAKVPSIGATRSGARVGVAFDLMRCTLSQLRSLPSMTRGFELMFPDEVEEQRQKKQKRRQQQQKR
eukprot:TRINITY_DN30913_c0_g1_i2.p1 TRINITY_DN30913_c0_g1~~TRINITY_DN30913_c0_g1_i2.p1  ORF type:complete len:102 (+),score=51.70 TRINITY_DN30913_c0_g1_i2:168-473(+)